MITSRSIALLLSAALLGGCMQTLGGSVAGGECKFLERPPYAVRGVASYDQDWIDSTVEGAIGACNWKRPAPRPAELDATPAPKAAAKPVKKRSAIGRAKDRIKSAWPAAPVAPVARLPDPPVAAEPVPIAPTPPPKPRRAIDELLHPGGRP